ncbi:MAG: hypothetical protein QOE26_2742 [Verrucomicrobiota bacterium]|jgi:hypothetical protein
MKQPSEEAGITTIADFTGLMSQGEFPFGIVSERGVVLKDELSESDWRHLLKAALDTWEKLGSTHLGMSMKVADILNWGEDHLGEKYANEIDLTRNALKQQSKTILNWQWVFKRIPPNLRHPALTYSHHEAVAKLAQDEQKEFLDTAESEGLNVKELREQIKERHPSKPRKSKDSVTKLDNAQSALQKMIDVSNWLSEHHEEIGKEWKEPLYKAHVVYRRRWQNGRAKR